MIISLKIAHYITMAHQTPFTDRDAPFCPSKMTQPLPTEQQVAQSIFQRARGHKQARQFFIKGGLSKTAGDKVRVAIPSTFALATVSVVA